MAIEKIFRNHQGVEIKYWRIEESKRAQASSGMGIEHPAGIVLTLRGFVDPAFQDVGTRYEFIESTLEDGRPIWYSKVMEKPEWAGSVET